MKAGKPSYKQAWKKLHHEIPMPVRKLGGCKSLLTVLTECSCGMAPAPERKSCPIPVVTFSCHWDSGLGLASLDEADEMGYSCSRSEAVLCTGSVSTGQGPLPSRASRDDDGVPEEALSTRPSAAVTAVHPIIDIIYVL